MESMQEEAMHETNAKEIVKSNSLIQASYTLGLAEVRIILLSIIEARKNEILISSDTFLEVSAERYAKEFSVTRQAAYMALSEAVTTLFQRQVTIFGIDEKTKKKEKRVIRWVSGISYVEDAGLIKLRFSPEVIAEITNLKENFTQYKLAQIAGLHSAYAVRLYEIVMQWQSKGKTPFFELEKLRMFLGISPEEYSAMCDFKKRVLDLSVKQINEKTNLNLSYTQKKIGRVVTHFSFEFSLKEESQTTKKEPKILGVSKGEIEKKARVGESYEEAAKRIKAELKNNKSSKERASREIKSMKEILEATES
jgi:plasmid replication initiation protein